VLVDGRIVKREGKLIAYDVDKICRPCPFSTVISSLEHSAALRELLSTSWHKGLVAADV